MSAGQRAPSEATSESAGRYRLSKQIASGGMGTIHLAHDRLLRRDVAYKRLKVASENARPRLTALFEREYNALRQLKHPNIVEVYDYGVDAEGPYYTMELLSGKDLASAAPLPLAEACRIIRDVASALALLHARRVVHRDVTPANVRLSRDGRAKLLDFGALGEFGVAKEIVGTPSFIAPECLSGDALDARTDLFALGCLAYWSLTKKHAYPARSMADLLDVWELPVSAPSLHVPSLPKELDELVLALIERDPVARPTSAAHVIERLTAIGNLAPEQDEAEAAKSFLMHPPLVGRRALLDQLKRFARETGEGKGRSVVIEASPGLGRSALLDHAAVYAQLAGANVLRFQPSGKRDAGLARSIVEWMRASFPALFREQTAKNPVFLRETRAPLRPAQSAGELSQQRSRLISAIQDAVDAMSEIAPLTLLIDDVHRADAESLALIVSLANQTADTRLLLILSQQERAVGSDANVLSELRSNGTTLALRPLDEADVEALVQGVFGSAPNSHRLSRFLHQKSGGNPSQCMDLCRLLLQQKEISYALGTFTLPFDPRGDVLDAHVLELTRLADLGPDALALARLLSLHDAALSSEQATSALAIDLSRTLLASEQLWARGLIFAHEGELSIGSESLRSALRQSLSDGERKALHLALSACILKDNPCAIEAKFAACHHLLRAGREDDAIALVWEPLRTSTMSLESTGICAPVLEQLLAAMRRRGHPDTQLWPLLHPLVVAGFWGELGISNRHRDAAITALANLTGIGLAHRLRPYLGKKVSLFMGLLFGIVRFMCTRKRFRSRSYQESMQRFISSVTMSTATAAAAFEPETAQRMVSFLDPLEAMKERSPGRVAREFARATAEVARGHNTRAAERYRRVMKLLDEHKIFDTFSQAGFYDGCLHGCAQAEVMAGDRAAMETAELLSKRHPFFKPHVETIRMTYHGLRGDKDLTDHHRKQGEMLALQGGLSWSAFTVMGIRSAYIAMCSEDTLGVLQASAELERLSAIAPNALLYRDMCRAYVALSRGELELAIDIYERTDALPNGHLMRVWELDRSFYAEALMRSDRLSEAKSVLEDAIERRRTQGASPFALRITRQQLALAEARLGHLQRAKQMLVELSREVEEHDGPLPLGSVRRDQARIALMEGDAEAFDRHFEAMIAAFRKSKNPALIQQCRRLLAAAVRGGVVASPNWEKHELVAPENSQDLTSQAPEVTELVETYS
jgi:tRNA A-37 threonylcarbamoyl transferase component Bud32/tetratricopeptide (TPR) repeat protein